MTWTIKVSINVKKQLQRIDKKDAKRLLDFLKNELARKDEKLEAVNKNIKQFKVILELVTDGLVVQDRHGHIAHNNHRFADLLGYKIEDLIKWKNNKNKQD